jgi:hypothetical protein
MTRPGDLLHALAARLFDRATLERLIDPVIADLQREHADALSRGQVWRSRWIYIASCIAFWKVAGVAALTSNKHGARAVAVALTAATLVTVLAICSVLAGTPATIHTNGNMARLILYLVPQGVAIGLPVCLALGLFIWIRREGADPSTKRTALWLMRLAVLLAVANTGWITPAANTAYRNVVAGRPTLRGVNELTFIELGQRVYLGSAGTPTEGQLATAIERQLPMAFWLNARLALTIAPVLLGILALAGATGQPRRSAAIVVFATLAVFAACYILVPDDETAVLMRWLPAAVIAWIPNVIVALATVSLTREWRLP